MPAQQQNPDGSWSDAVPLGWQGSGIDWEVSGHGPYEALGYDEDVLVARVEARNKFTLGIKLWWWHKRHPDSPPNREART